MTMRTTSKTVTFHRPSWLKGVDRLLPPADYRVVTDEKLIEGLSFPAYHRVSTVIFVPGPSDSAVEMVTFGDPEHPKAEHAQNPIDLAGGHKMTDDEIREALRLDFEQTADWRRSKAAEYPEDSRNLEAAALLDKLAAYSFWWGLFLFRAPAIRLATGTKSVQIGSTYSGIGIASVTPPVPSQRRYRLYE